MRIKSAVRSGALVVGLLAIGGCDDYSDWEPPDSMLDPSSLADAASSPDTVSDGDSEGSSDGGSEGTDEPDGGDLDAEVVDVADPDSAEPDATTTDAADPDSVDPDTTDPDTTDPDTTDPDTTDPDTTDPDATGRDIAEPDTVDEEDGDTPELTGEEIFAANCSGCHGADAAGTDLAPQLRNMKKPYGTWVIRNGRVGDYWPIVNMPSFSEEALPSESVDKIFDYLHGFEKPDTGPELFGRFCVNCHGPDGLGGPTNENVVEEAHDKPWEVLETVREGEGGSNYGNRFEYMPSWTAEEITNNEVQLILDYLLTLPF